MYTLRDLSPNYLNEIFGLSDILKIQQEIECTVANVNEKIQDSYLI